MNIGPFTVINKAIFSSPGIQRTQDNTLSLRRSVYDGKGDAAYLFYPVLQFLGGILLVNVKPRRQP